MLREASLLLVDLSKEASEPTLQPWGRRQEDSYAPHQPVGPNTHRNCARKPPSSVLNSTNLSQEPVALLTVFCSPAYQTRSHHNTQHSASLDMCTGKAGTCEILSSRQKNRFPEVPEASQPIAGCSIISQNWSVVSEKHETYKENVWIHSQYMLLYKHVTQIGTDI